jgi:Ca-activated chloride channel homolog
MGGAPPAVANGPPADTLSLSHRLLHNVYESGLAQETHLAVTVRAAETASQRLPVSMVIVLDHSGSMAGEKLQMCKHTIAFIMGQLGSRDRLALVWFDDRVSSHDFVTMDEAGKAQLRTCLNKISAGGTTNLSGGLLKAIQDMEEKARRRAGADAIEAIMLLTDGHANCGIVDPKVGHSTHTLLSTGACLE